MTDNTLFAWNLHQTLAVTQNSHGVGVEDYQQYHKYCSHRIDRLRHASAEMRQWTVHNSKYVDGVQMKRKHAFCPRTIVPPEKKEEENVNEEETNADESKEDEIKEETKEAKEEAKMPIEVVYLLFFQAERAWAQACSLQLHQKQSSSLSSAFSTKRKKHSTKNVHQQVLSRLRKACKWADQLHTAASRLECDPTTRSEIQAYVAWIKGNYALEKSQYATAFTEYKTAINLLLQLTREHSSKDDAEALVLRDVWTTRAERVLRPLARYCQYEAKDSSLVLDDASQVSEATPSSSIVLHFRGQEIALDGYKQLCVLYLKLEPMLAQQRAPKSTDDEQDSQFLSLLSILDEADRFLEELMIDEDDDMSSQNSR